MQAITQLRKEANMLKIKSAADDREIGLLKRKVDMQNAAIQSQITCIEGLVASDLGHQERHADVSSQMKKDRHYILDVLDHLPPGLQYRWSGFG